MVEGCHPAYQVEGMVSECPGARMSLRLGKVSNSHLHRGTSLLGIGFFSFGSNLAIEELEDKGRFEGATACDNQSN